MHPAILTELQRTPLRERIYSALLREIVAGRLEPGHRIRDAALAGQLGVSRTPVREALQRLQDEGLVEASPGASTRVAPVDRRSLEQAFPVVACLHAMATRLAVPHLEPQHLAALRRINRRFAEALAAEDPVRAIESDDAFHGLFEEVAANRELATALARLTPKVRRLEYMQFASAGGRRSVSQHDGIIAAAGDGDAALSAQLVEANWLSLGQLLIEAIPTEQT